MELNSPHIMVFLDHTKFNVSGERSSGAMRLSGFSIIVFPAASIRWPHRVPGTHTCPIKVAQQSPLWPSFAHTSRVCLALVRYNCLNTAIVAAAAAAALC